MRRRFLAAALPVLLSACRDLPTPAGGVQAISRVLLPSPGVVVGDTMRDSLGAVAPLRVVAFDENGDTIVPAPPASFALFDTTARLVGDLLIGRATGRVRIVATVAGLQTRADTAFVTLRPDTIVPGDSTRFERPIDLLSSDATFASPELKVIVQHREGASATGIDAVIVHYALVRAPAPGPNGSGPTVVFVNGTDTASRDTTSGGGLAARSIHWRRAALSQLPDSAVVTATASYRGQSLGTVQFTIVFMTQ